MRKSVFDMSFATVYQALIAKAERKDRTLEEVYQVTTWLTGYSREQLEEMRDQEGLTYGDFFRAAPQWNQDRAKVKGKICGVQIEEIEDPMMQEMRRLDKLVDELAKGRPMEKILNRK